jgi:signal transduction histidine kinase
MSTSTAYASSAEDHTATVDRFRTVVVSRLRFFLGVVLAIAVTLLAADWRALVALGCLILYLRAYRLYQRQYPDGGTIRWEWLDVCICVGIVMATGGFASPVLAIALLPIAMLGICNGLRAALVAAILGILALSALGGAEISMPPWALLLVPSIVLMLVLWVRSEFSALRHSAMLNDMNANVRYDGDLTGYAARLALYLHRASEAEACLVTIEDGLTQHCSTAFSVNRSCPAFVAEHAIAEMPKALQNLRGIDSLFTSRPRSRWAPPVFDLVEPHPASEREATPAVLAELDEYFGRKPLASFPLLARGRSLGRVVILSRSYLPNSTVSKMFLLAGQAALVIENAQLADEVRTATATKTKKRISMDLHDGVIQPIIGLRMALEALRAKAHGALASEIDEIIGMANDGIHDLRSYVGALRNPGQPSGAARPGLVEDLKRQASRFSRDHGIFTTVKADCDVSVDDTLQEEVSYIIKEGLSNIGRHSNASKAAINLSALRGRLLVEFLNDDRTGRLADATFFPKSIGERASELGGSVIVRRCDGGLTSVSVDLPISAP